MSTIFEQQLDYIYFFYGLAFILLATVCLSIHRTSERRLAWLWLGLFGLIHGIAEWSDLVAISIGDNVSFKGLRLFLVAASFSCLFEFGRRGLNRLSSIRLGLWIYVPLILLAVTGALSGMSAMNTTVRYSLGLSGGLLSAWVLLRAAKTAKRAGNMERFAGLATAGYAVAVVIVPQASFFPASEINTTEFAAAFGIPIQLLRGVIAILLAAFIWSYYQRSRTYLDFSEPGKLTTGGLTLTLAFISVLVAGWTFTEIFAGHQQQLMKENLAHQAAIASESFDSYSKSILKAGLDPDSPDYAFLQKHVSDFQGSNPQIRGVCLLAFDDSGALKTIVSSGPFFAGPSKGEHPDEAASRLAEDLSGVLEKGQPSAVGPYDAESYSYISSYAPVHDAGTGETIAAIGIDFDAASFKRSVALDRLLPIGITLLISLIAIAAYVTRQNVAERAEILESAKKRFSMLTHKAIMDRHWEVGFEDNYIPTCWEKKSCVKTDCPVYGKQHARCWLIAGTFCRGQVQGRFANKLGDCSKCEVYQEALSHGPVSEIGENFNSLMWSLREKEELLEAANDELGSQNLELQELHRVANERADTDGLTGLKNHGHFQHHLSQEVDRARRYDRPLSLVMIDLDNFKQVNDKFGHQKGDAILKSVGKLLLSETRDADYSARYGGEEFVVIMPEISGEEAVEAADRLRMKIELLYKEVDLPEHQTAASFGVADFPVCSDDANSLIAAADGALLFAKRQGRNRVAYFKDLSQAELSTEDIDSLNSRLEGTGFHTIKVLAAAVDARDHYSDSNLNDMSGAATAVAKKLHFGQDQLETLLLATNLHDIGKIGVPTEILGKKEKLLPEELELLHRHPQVGEQILKEAAQIQDLISAVLYHHERWDGKGYPEGLSGEDIPVMARIVGILDAYRAMVSDRPYSKALTTEEAAAELRRGAGTQFDPDLVELFLEQGSEEGEDGRPKLRRVV